MTKFLGITTAMSDDDDDDDDDVLACLTVTVGDADAGHVGWTNSWISRRPIVGGLAALLRDIKSRDMKADVP